MLNPVFIIGSGRSGTTWLHLMLGSHPQVATGQESQLFHNYFRAMRAKWDDELAYPETESLRFHGISSYIDEEKFYSLMRQFADGVYSSLFEEKPEANILLEKSPNNSFNIDTIHRCYPNARFLHVIRDGRDVVSSMLSAKKGWGKQWAPSEVEPAAKEWKTAVRQACEAKMLSNHYLEIRYEKLLEDGYAELKKAFEFIGAKTTKEQITQIYNEHGFDKLKAGHYKKDTFLNPGQTLASGTQQRAEPKDFFNKGKAGNWKTVLNASQQHEFYYFAGDLLEQLGYSSQGTTHRKKPLKLHLRHGLKKVKFRIKTLAKKIIG